MPDNPTFSIVTPSYQQGSVLEDTLKSVLRQDNPPLEHLVMDGGSTDETLEILERYQRDHPAVFSFVSGPDEGQTDAINKGFENTSGEIVAWLNSDDVYFPGALGHAARIFSTRPDVDAVFGKGVFLDADGVYITDFPHNGPFDPEQMLAGYATLLQPTVFWRRSVLDRIGPLDTTLHYSMDYDLWCRMSKAGIRFHYDEENYYAAARFYRETKTASGAWKRAHELRQVARKYSHRRFPAITFYSLVEAAMSSKWANRIYRPLKKRLHGQDIDYWEIPFPDTRGPCRITFPYYRALQGLRLTVERLQPGKHAAASFTLSTAEGSEVRVEAEERFQTIEVNKPCTGDLIDLHLSVAPDDTPYRVTQIEVLP